MSYLEFTHTGTTPSGKTHTWDVRNSMFQMHLGVIKWHAPWRKYLFFPDPQTAFDTGCLGVIRDFILNEMEKRKNA